MKLAGIPKAARYTAPLFLMACALAGAAPASAALAAPAETPATVVKREIRYDLADDGSYVLTRNEVLRINTLQGAKQFAQLPMSYNKRLQSLEVLEAYTVGTDMKRVDVKPESIKEQAAAQNGQAQFDDARVRALGFQGLTAGAELHLKVRRAQREAIFPGQFSVVEVFSNLYEFRHASVTVRAPRSMKLFAEAVQLKGGRVADDGDTQVWIWSLADAPARSAEAASVSAADGSPRVAVTTFATDAEAAHAYRRQAGRASIPTQGVAQQADEITQGMSDSKSQAEAIVRWVSANIRHIPVLLDFGGAAPHAADDILATKVGDAKDHVALLEALLAAKGIASQAVLVNSRNAYWVPKVAAVPGVYDHVIAYLPQFDQYADTASGHANLGALPMAECGKWALMVAPAPDSPARVGRVSLPMTRPASDQVTTEVRMVLKSDGTVEGAAIVDNTGVFEQYARQTFARIGKGGSAQVAGNVLKLTGQTGTGDYLYQDPRDLARAFRYNTQFSLPNRAKLPGPGQFQVPDGLSSLSNIVSTFESIQPEQREWPIPLASRRIEEVIRLALPDEMHQVEVPAPVEVKSRFGSFKMSADLDAQRVLTLRRSLVIDHATPVIASTDYTEFRQFGQAVLAAIRAPVRFQ